MVFGNRLLWKKLPDNLFQYVEGSKIQQTVQEESNDEHESVDSTTERNESNSVEEDDDSTAENPETDIDLADVLASVEFTLDNVENEIELLESEDDIHQLSGLEKSMDEMSILEDEDIYNTPSYIQDLLESFDFKKFQVPPLLCRHPPPAIGRDDDILKIKEILDDVLMKMGYEADASKKVNQILCGPDNKIGKCLLSLIKQDPKYRVFLPEFPLLHLRKSKITMLFSAYRDAGIVQILRFMRDEEFEEWAKLISIQHIDMATKHVRRLALAFHLAFFISFTQYLDADELHDFINDLEVADCSSLSEKWSKTFEEYIAYGSSRNATFSLHVDMMNHCDSVIAISLAERLGGSTGYGLLLAAVKKSLSLSFVNNASYYAPFCVKLLYHHYSAGYFHCRLKETLYSTPFKGSSRNFACDTKREMDHLEVTKGFRAGSTVESVSCRMALVDSLNETKHTSESKQEDTDKLGWEITDVDMNHIYPTAELILRRGGHSLEESTIPFNVYTKISLLLPSSILDSASEAVGKFLLLRYVQKEKMFNLNNSLNILDNTIQGPPDLVSRAKKK